MKKSVKKGGLWVIGMIALAAAGGACQKDKITDLPEEEKQLKEVTFSVSGFKAALHPLLKMDALAGKRRIAGLNSLMNQGNVPASEEEQLLYFWSFNQENAVPDIGIDTLSAAVDFSSNNQSGKVSYVGGRAFSPYPAGQCYSVNGPKEIWFKIPVAGVTGLQTLSFDIGSSNTGPKDFALAYSLDNEPEYMVLEENNQFINTTSSSWNRFEYDLSALLLEPDTEILWIKLELKSGDRGSGSGYNETSGTVRIDNLGVTGIYTAENQGLPELTGGTVHYHFFRKQDSTLAISGKQTFTGGKEAIPEINVLLEEGMYFGSFVVNFSDEDLIIPAAIPHADNFYMRNSFDNSAAVSYGTLIAEFQVDQDTQRELILERYYSEVQFQFTDDTNLDQIGKIRITEVYPVYYTPFFNGQHGDFGVGGTTGNTSLTIVPDWSDGNHGIRFHQFLGLLDQPQTIDYELDVYGPDDELLRNFTVQADLVHNTMLIFSGKLLQDSGENEIGLVIRWIEDWREIKTVEF